MRTLARLLLLPCLLAVCGTRPASAALSVNGTPATSTGTTQTVAVAPVTTAAGVIVVYAKSASAADGVVLQVTDTGGLTWAKRKSVAWDSGATFEEWYAQSPGAYSGTVSVKYTNNTANSKRLAAFGVSSSTASAVSWDANASLPASNSGGALTALAPSASYSTSNANAMLLAAVGNDSGMGTVTRPGGFTQVLATGTAHDFAYKVVSATQSAVTNGYSWTTAGANTVGIWDALQEGTPALAAGTASVTSTGNGTASVAVGAASNGTPPYTYQWYRSTTAGFTPGAGNLVSGATSLTLNDSGLTNGTTYYYADVVTDGASGTAASNQISATPANTALTSGAASLSSIGSGAVSVTATAASGGGGTYTYQWYRSTDPSVLGPAASGATSLSLNDTGLTNGTPYYYKLQATDGTTTVTSNQVSGVPAAPFYLGVIGDSWTNTVVTAGGTSTSPSAAAAGNLVGNQLQALFQDGTQVVPSNQGVGGTNGNDWAPGGANMNAAVAAFNAVSPTHSNWTVLVHLGINDSSVNYSSPTGGESKAQYKAYLQAIVTYLLDTWGAGKVVLVGPPDIKDVSANHPAANVTLLVQYNAALQEVAAARPGRAYATASEYNFITNNQQFLGGDKVHPTPPDANGQGGSAYIAGLWAKAAYDAARPISLWTHY